MNNLLIQLKRSRWTGRKECRGIFQQILKAHEGDVQATYMYLFNNLGTGEFSEYLLGHVHGDIKSWWECFSKKWLWFLYTLAEVKVIAWSVGFIKAVLKSLFYYLDIVKDIRSITLILIPLLPASMHLIVMAFSSLLITEAAKMIQLYSIQKKRSPFFGPVEPFFLHHDELMEEIQLHHLALIPSRDDDQEQTFTRARQQRVVTNLTKAEMRATENVIEHLPQIIIPLSMLTLKGAQTELMTTEGKTLFFFLSLTFSFMSIVRGQVSLISARKKGHLDSEAKLLLSVYQIFAILPRTYAIVLLLNGMNTAVSFPILGLVALLHILLSCATQKILFKEEKNLFWQALWTFLTPPLFLDWDTLYRQQGYKMSVQECWSRTKYCIIIHNTLTLLGNVTLDRVVGLGWTQIVSSEIDTVLKFVILICIHIILIGLSFLYFKRLHPWARLLNAELTKQPPTIYRKRNSKIHPTQADKSKQSPDLGN